MRFVRENVQIGVFGRLPGASGGKTRLARDVGAERAGALATAFLGDVLARAALLAPGRTWWWIAPGAEAPDDGALVAAGLRSGLAPAGIRLAVQRGAHLGQRMEHALAAMLGEGPALLVGADAPDAPLSAVLEAIAWLGDEADRGDRARLVLGPAGDGGFWLVGSDAPPGGLLGAHAEWGHGGVLERTRAEAARSGAWDVHSTATWSDVDTGPDLEALATRLSAARARGEAARPGWPARTASLVLGGTGRT